MSTLTRTTTGDIALPLSFQRDVATITAQKLQDELNLWQGEWFLDVTQGFPWIQRVLGIKNPSVTQLRALLTQAILETPAIVAVDNLQLTITPGTRHLSYTFTATLDDGTVLTGGPGVPFVVGGGPTS